MDGLATLGYDCVIIPGASKKTAGVNTAGQPTNGDLKISEFCGRQLGTHLSTATLGARATVCSKIKKNIILKIFYFSYFFFNRQSGSISIEIFVR